MKSIYARASFAATMVIAAAMLFVLAASGDASAQEQDYYLYQRGGFGLPGDLMIETESAYGTREQRLLAEDAFEQSLRARVNGTNWLSVEAWAGMVFYNEDEKAQTVEDAEAAEEAAEAKDENEDTDTAFAGDVYARVLSQEKAAIDLSLGLGFLYDYGQTSIPRAHLAVQRTWGKVDATFSALAELPLEEEEEEEEGEDEDNGAYVGTEGEEEEEEEEEGAYDEVDLILSAAASYGVAEWSRVGVESVLEDMEGFWEEEEAEGGAKMVLGPTATFLFLENAHARLNLAAVIPMTRNDQTRYPGQADPNTTGFMGRAAIGYQF